MNIKFKIALFVAIFTSFVFAENKELKELKVENKEVSLEKDVYHKIADKISNSKIKIFLDKIKLIGNSYGLLKQSYDILSQRFNYQEKFLVDFFNNINETYILKSRLNEKKDSQIIKEKVHAFISTILYINSYRNLNYEGLFYPIIRSASDSDYFLMRYISRNSHTLFLTIPFSILKLYGIAEIYLRLINLIDKTKE